MVKFLFDYICLFSFRNRLVFFFSVGCIVCHTLADIFLFQSNLGHNFRHKWLPLFLRSVIQMITSAALSLGVKSSPLGPPASIALNIVLVRIAESPIFEKALCY